MKTGRFSRKPHGFCSLLNVVERAMQICGCILFNVFPFCTMALQYLSFFHDASLGSLLLAVLLLLCSARPVSAALLGIRVPPPLCGDIGRCYRRSCASSLWLPRPRCPAHAFHRQVMSGRMTGKVSPWISINFVRLG
jgi:hypothetical protein